MHRKDDLRYRRSGSTGRGDSPLRRLAVPLSLLLVAEAGLVAATAAPAAAETATTRKAEAAFDPSKDTKAPDEESARLAAAVQDRQIEVVGARTEHTTLWANPDGTMSLESHAGPVRFKRDGAWVDVDATLRKAADGSIRAKAHPRGLRLAGRTGAGGGDLVTLGRGDQTVTLGWKGALPEPVLKGHRATYVNALPKTDLVVEATRTGFEQYLVVKDRSAAERAAEVALPLRAEGLDTVQNADDSITFTDPETKKTVGRIPAPFMWDASGQKKTPRSGKHRAEVGLDLARTARGAELRLTADRDFLTDEDTRYPVTIDPAAFLGPNFDTTLREGSTEDLSASPDLAIGREYGKGRTESYLRFGTYEEIEGKTILNAELNLFPVWADQCEPREWEVGETDPVSSTTRWSTKPAWRKTVATSSATSGHTSGTAPYCGSEWVNVDVTSMVSEWSKQDRDTYTIGLRAKDPDDYTAFKIFASSDDVDSGPSLLVTYQTPADPVKDHVHFWNDVLLTAYRTVGGAPGPLARAGAMMHGAIYDAANSVKCAEGPTRCLGEPYLTKVSVPASPLPDINSAIDQAAYDVLKEVYPGAVDLAKALSDARASIPSTVTATQRAAGQSVGQKAAAAMLAARADDGSATSNPYPGSQTPGYWRPTDGTPAATPDWGRVKPFGLLSGSQARPAGPGGHTTMADLLKSDAYADQVKEVKDLGGATSTLRTADQEHAAFFWANDLNGTYKPPGQLFEMTQVVSLQHRMSVEGNAKLFALVAFSMADAGIAAWDAKYLTEIDLWRPESAINLDGDGNPDTLQDSSWRPLSKDQNGNRFSPSFPAYVSGHATFGGAWAKAVEQWFRTDQVTFTAGTEDFSALNTTRTFTSFSAAARENARSRVWLGVHYDWDGTEGVSTGNKVGEYVSANKLKANNAADWQPYEDLSNLGGCEATGRMLVAEHRWNAYQCVSTSTANDNHRLYVK
ncbi:hypothetical protein GCM10010420_30550 [Streptomyces glaucosporus]|uniref:Carbohydrate-binding module family 96 domain-containing protein n=1 Tax=Streptomyces glaucosporus TaxID=284044 RepID=A0ABN3IDE7_9ACTN